MESKNHETILNTGQDEALYVKVDQCSLYHVIDPIVLCKS